MRNRWLGLAVMAFILVAPLVPLSQQPMDTWLDESHQSFFPRESAEKLSAYQRFPVFWWNFLVFDPNLSGEIPDSATIASLCKRLGKENAHLLKSVPCASSFAGIRSLLQDWSADLVLRRGTPAVEDAGGQMSATLAQASLPLEREILELLRVDPFGASGEFEKLMKEKVKSGFNFENGVFHDKKTGRILLPVQLSYSPSQTKNTRELVAWLATLAPLKPRLIGAHHSTLENEQTVRDDIKRVSVWGATLLAFALLIIFARGHWRILVFFPPLLVSTAAAIAWTIGVFGSIHGLALAFGPGVIGLSMDYAVHAAFSPSEKKKTWLANFLGVLTTLTVIAAGLLSSVPVLRQLMFFSGAGLLIGFLVFYAFQEFFPTLFVEKAFVRRVRGKKPIAIVTLMLAAASVVALITLKPAFRMTDLNFETAETKNLRNWLMVGGAMRTPYLQLLSDERSPLEEAVRDFKWAEANHFFKESAEAIESIARYIPTVAEQKKHLQSWQSQWCKPKSTAMPTDLFFEPYFTKLCAMTGDDLRYLAPGDPVPSYLEDLHATDNSQKKWLSLWFPDSEAKLALLKEKFPGISSVGEVVEEFPRILVSEISWMAPITFLISVLLLLVYFRSAFLVFCATLPFFSGLGTYVFASWFIDLKVSFITLIGFIMVFGFSLDYGIFSTDAEDSISKGDSHDARSKTHSAMTLTSLLTFAGVVPLILAKHPAMKHLGEALVFGSIGTYLGAIWGVPFVYEQFQRPANGLIPFRTITKAIVLAVLLLLTFSIATFHMGTVQPPDNLIASASAPRGEFFPREKFGVNQIFLEGSAFDRGKLAGELTKKLIYAQETELLHQAEKFIPTRTMLKAAIVVAMQYFRGLDRFFEPWALQEIFGISLSASSDFDDLADGYTRQIGYHGLHEIGQMMVGQRGNSMGCTVVLIPVANSWVIGRNFDFEGGRIFDEEKLVKWTFPESPLENAYVSIVWSGMVGAVTGVNEYGLFVSLNAAGSSDYKRVGTPSTIVISKVLQFSKTIEDAIEILRNEQMFITDIFAVVDAKSGRAFRVEKSPQKTAVTELKTPSVITNHLVSQEFSGDETDELRRAELTSVARFNRGTELLEKLGADRVSTSTAARDLALSILRDKKGTGDTPLALHNRKAIDALIATHSVLYDASKATLYVSQGPGVSGAFTGFDLKKSFRDRAPRVIDGLPSDPLITPKLFKDIHLAESRLQTATKLMQKNKCEAAGREIANANVLYNQSSRFESVRGDWLHCLGRLAEAKAAWAEALNRSPAYTSEVQELERKIEGVK